MIDKKIFDTKYKRKKWAVNHSKSLLPYDLFKKFLSFKKKDDIADAIIIGDSIIKNMT
jgi:hypothetical protein